MWSYAAGGVSLSAIGYAYHHYHHRSNEDLIDRIENIRCIEDVVHILQTLASEQTTESVTENISDTIVSHGIRESALSRLSALHRRYGSDDGCYGYAINVLWSTVLDAVVNGAVIIVEATPLAISSILRS